MSERAGSDADSQLMPQMQWSRNIHLFPCEPDRGGYLPIIDSARVWFEEAGYRGWVSMEVFSRSMSEKDEIVPRTHAQRGVATSEALLKERWPNKS